MSRFRNNSIYPLLSWCQNFFAGWEFFQLQLQRSPQLVVAKQQESCYKCFRYSTATTFSNMYMVCNIFEQKIDIYFIVFCLIRERGWADTSGYIITPQPPRPKTNNYWQFCILRPLLVMAHVISAFFWMAQSQLNEMNGLTKLHIPSTVVNGNAS